MISWAAVGACWITKNGKVNNEVHKSHVHQIICVRSWWQGAWWISNVEKVIDK